MASFDDKIEALRKLREKRQARQQKEAVECPAVAEPTPAPSAAIDQQNSSQSTGVGNDLEGRELAGVLQHYAGLHSSSKAAKSSTPAAGLVDREGGDEADALYCLGHCFEQGLHECDQDLSKAVAYYRMAAEKGSVVGQWRLGHLHEYGLGVEQCDAFAAHWYRLAAEAGHAQAQSSLALLLEDGRVRAENEGEALRWHLAAAAQDQALSQYCAACCLAEGRGAAKDEEAAMIWLKKSAAAGFPPAVEALASGNPWKTSSSQGDADAALLKLFSSHADEAEADADEALLKLFSSHDEEAEADYVPPVADAAGDNGLMDLASRVAKQIGHLSDDDAEAFLDKLMSSNDFSAGLGFENLEDMLSRADKELDLEDDGGFAIGA